MGSGGPGRTMSAMDGEENEVPLPFGGGDLRELALFARLLESPLVFILAVLLRLKRPICEVEARMLRACSGELVSSGG